MSLAFCYPWLNILYVPLTNLDKKLRGGKNIMQGPLATRVLEYTYIEEWRPGIPPGVPENKGLVFIKMPSPPR